jgi:hypothetical protein
MNYFGSFAFLSENGFGFNVCLSVIIHKLPVKQQIYAMCHIEMAEKLEIRIFFFF